MVRLSAASLNSLAEILRHASPLYAECRSILNYLDREDGIVSLPAPENHATGADCISANKDADSLPQSILEPMAPDPKSIM
jgi:hypothetical protein